MCRHDDFIADPENDEDKFAVRGWRAGGVAVLGVGSALTLGIAGSVTNIVSYFYEKCYSNYFAKIEVVPLNS